jgi:outer membrane lipoprotein SlyB
MDDEHGQAMPLVLAVVAFAAVLLFALVPVAEAAHDRARARSAADAAALAGAADGEEAARAMAEVNGAELVLWRTEGPEVWVEVRLGDARATAKARRG